MNARTYGTNTLATVWQGHRCPVCEHPKTTEGMCLQCQKAHQLGYLAGYQDGRFDALKETHHD